MAIARKGSHRPDSGYRETTAKQGAAVRKAGKATSAKATAAAGENDYNGMPLDEWKTALKKDVDERFGPVPDNLIPTGEAGW